MESRKSQDSFNKLYGLRHNLIGNRSGEIPKDRVIPRSKSETEASISVAEYRDEDGGLVYMYDAVEVPNTTVSAGAWRDNLIFECSDGSIKIDGNDTTKTIDFTIDEIESGSILDTDLKANSIRRLSTVSAISVLDTGVTTLYTVPTGKSCVITGVFIRIASYDGTGKTTEATFNLGANSSDFDDYLSGVSYTTTEAIKVIRAIPAIGTAYDYYTAGEVFSINVTVASDGTTEEWTLDTFGYLI